MFILSGFRLLLYHDGVGGLEGGAGSEGVDPVLVTEVAGVAMTVAAAEPRLDADERRVLARWRPEADYWSVETDCKIRSSIRPKEGDFGDLAVLKHYRVYDVECVLVQRQDAAFLKSKRVHDLCIHAAFFADSDAFELGRTGALGRAVKDKETSLNLRHIIVRIIEDLIRQNVQTQQTCTVRN